MKDVLFVFLLLTRTLSTTIRTSACTSTSASGGGCGVAHRDGVLGGAPQAVTDITKTRQNV